MSDLPERKDEPLCIQPLTQPCVMTPIEYCGGAAAARTSGAGHDSSKAPVDNGCTSSSSSVVDSSSPLHAKRSRVDSIVPIHLPFGAVLDASPLSLDERLCFLRRWTLLRTPEQMTMMLTHVAHQVLRDVVKHVIHTAPPALVRTIGATMRQATDEPLGRRPLKNLPSVTLSLPIVSCIQRQRQRAFVLCMQHTASDRLVFIQTRP